MRKKQTKEKKLKTLEMNKSTKSTSVNTQRFSRYTLNLQSRQQREDMALSNCPTRNSMHYPGMEWSTQNQSIEPKIDNLWNALFAEGTSTPLQTLMIRVNENKATTPVNKN
jgi:hypothetical protein